MEFISLSEIIKAVANCVTTPKNWQGTYLHSKEELPPFKAVRLSLFNAFVSEIYRYSEATANATVKVGNKSITYPKSNAAKVLPVYGKNFSCNLM